MNHLMAQKHEEAHSQLEAALDANKNCVRANVLLGDLEADEGRNAAAIGFWKRIEFQQPEYLGLIAGKLLKSHAALGKLPEGLALLNHYAETYQLSSVMHALYEATLAESGPESAAKLSRNELIRKPSLQTLDQLLQARAMDEKNQIPDIQLMQQTVRNAIGNRAAYYCDQCGFRAKQHHWRCPACNAWESLPAEPTETITREMTVKQK
jgi:lipopolysaccharide biosynthesis regulator YciM